MYFKFSHLIDYFLALRLDFRVAGWPVKRRQKASQKQLSDFSLAQLLRRQQKRFVVRVSTY